MTRVVRIVHGAPMPEDAVRVRREATRAVVRCGDDVLLLVSRSGAYRFPGGGPEIGRASCRGRV